MRSLRGGRWLVVGGLVGSCVRGAAVPTPTITPAPSLDHVDLRLLVERQDPDAISLARVLLSALPLSLRVIAATNLQAVSSVLWEEFLDDKRPDWFRSLPYDIQSYLIREFGPKTAAPPDSPGWDGEASTTQADSPSETGGWQPSQTDPAGSEATTLPSETNPSWSDVAPSETEPQASGVEPSNTGDSSFASTPTTLVTTRSGSATVSQARSETDASASRTSGSSATSSSSSSAEPAVPAEDGDGGLTQKQKVGLGVGIPFGIIGAAALFFGCCFLLRRRKKHNIDGSIPPSSPGFIPRFSFQDRAFSYEHHEHRAPLNPSNQQSTAYNGPTNWEDDGYDPADFGPPQRASTFPPTHAVAEPMAMHDPTPIMAPALFHTHSSNRARGKRTSYTSLRSVAELTEPDEENHTLSVAESPVLGAYGGMLPGKQPNARRSSLPSVSEVPPVVAADAATGAGIAAAAIAGSNIKRKPVPTSPTGLTPTRETTRSKSLLRPPLLIPENSGSSSSSSGRAIGAISNESSTSKLSQQTNATSPVSPISPTGTPVGMNPFVASNSTNLHGPSSSQYHNYNALSNTSPSAQKSQSNPFAGGYDYLEDYGPEFSHNGYMDLYSDDGLYGGNRSLDRYPEPSSPTTGRRGSKGEWPLRNVMGSGHKRNKSPLWDRVYDRPR